LFKLNEATEMPELKSKKGQILQDGQICYQHEHWQRTNMGKDNLNIVSNAFLSEKLSK
jgi:hypothetical protein